MGIDRSYQPLLISQARLKLREIQARLTEQGIARKPRLMVQSPCGSGKTRIAGMITQSALDRGGRVMFLAHRSFLAEQTSLTFKDMKIPHSFMAAGKPFNPNASVHVGMIGSVKSRIAKLKHRPSMILIDEGHRGVAATYRWVSENFPDATIMYLSATPSDRTDGVGLGEVCDDIVLGPQVADLIRLGALSDFKWMRGQPPEDLHNVKMRVGGDDALEKQGDIMSRAVIVGSVVENYKAHFMGKKAIYFFPNIATGKKYAEAFCAAGVPMAWMDKDTPEWERKRIARKIADGELYGFCNAFIAGEGYDLAAQAGKDVTIEVVGLCRLTASFPLLVQMAMRAMRPKADGAPGIIADHVDCYGSFEWLPDDLIEWTLAGAVRKPKEVKAVQCPHCLATAIPIKHKCKHCGEDVREGRPGAATRREIEEVRGELAEVERAAHEAAKAAATMDRKRAIASLNRAEEIIAYGRAKGYKEGWAKKLIEVKRERGRLVA